MTSADPTGRTIRQPLRLWPGLAAVVVQWLLWMVVPLIVPEAGLVAVLGTAACGLVIVLWWLLFSRAPWVERIGALVLIAVAFLATQRLVHPSIATGAMGFLLPLYAIPVVSLALVVWAAATRHASSGLRRASMVAAILLAFGAFTLIRTGGIRGEGGSDLHWRWTPTPEERLLALTADRPIGPPRAADPSSPPAPAAPPATAPPAPAAPAPGAEKAPAAEPAPVPAEPAAGDPAATPGAAVSEPTAPPAAAPAHAAARIEWPGFRGPERNGIVPGLRIGTDWSRTPPVELWRRPIGPGWSSFAVRGNLVYTQEQRGEDEIVSAYELKTGDPVWQHRDAARFWESNAGPGPRATPTVSGGRVYTLGATGILNALDARTGAVVWSRNAVTDTGKKIPDWGIASSPLVIGDVVVAATAGWLAAYDAATGSPRWFGPKTGWGYSSPHLATIDGEAQVVLVNGAGALGVRPSDGTVLWKHAWPGDSIVQPAVLAGGDLLIGTGSGMGSNSGMSRVTVSRAAGAWQVTERWVSRGLKPYFNDFVVNDGHAFGFDGSILACIDLADGARKWKGGRYGNGQLVLLPDQDLLLVLSEEGELALVGATPDGFTELARFPAIEGKTWNHPVVVGDVLLVRNGEEMAAFRLPAAGS